MRRTDVDRAHAERSRVLLEARALVAVGEVTEDEEEELAVLGVQQKAVLEPDLVTAQRKDASVTAPTLRCGSIPGLTRLRVSAPVLR